MLGSVVIDRVQIILNDITAVRWTAANLLDWLNEGQKAIVRVAPEAFTVTANLQLAPGTRQNITSLAVTGSTNVPLRVIDVTHNVTDATGLPPLRAIRIVNRKTLDQYNPDWPADTAAATVQHWMFDSRNPREFFVYPAQPGTAMGFVEIVYSAEPTDLASEASSIGLADVYAAPLVDYIVHRALSADTEYGANPQRVAQHYNQFLNGITQKTQGDVLVEPAMATSTGTE